MFGAIRKYLEKRKLKRFLEELVEVNFDEQFWNPHRLLIITKESGDTIGGHRVWYKPFGELFIPDSFIEEKEI